MNNLEWANPNKRRDKPKTCEFCRADVSTPYKGVHDETEIINGFPVACRNNGRMNADIAFPELAKLHKQPVEGIKWFVEHKETHLWWTGYEWTNDPQRAFGCDLENTADRYARLKGIKDYIVTEHEFVNQIEKEK